MSKKFCGDPEGWVTHPYPFASRLIVFFISITFESFFLESTSWWKKSCTTCYIYITLWEKVAYFLHTYIINSLGKFHTSTRILQAMSTHSAVTTGNYSREGTLDGQGQLPSQVLGVLETHVHTWRDQRHLVWPSWKSRCLFDPENGLITL